MRSLILVAVILQLTVIIIEINGYQFGDIIAFPRKCCIIPLYKHYAIYVGNQPFEGKQQDQYIFHHTVTEGNGLNPKVSGCIFGKLNPEEKQRLSNRLDGKTYKGNTINKLPDEDIKNHIEEMMTEEGCGKYNLLKNNCGHLATYVRYGLKLMKQGRTWVAPICALAGKRGKRSPEECTEYKRAVEEIEENAKKEEACWRRSFVDLAG